MRRAGRSRRASGSDRVRGQRGGLALQAPEAGSRLLHGGAALTTCSLALAGCAGGLPLLHPAQTLEAGQVRAAAGFSANVGSAGFADALRTATNEAAMNPNPAGPPPDESYAKGVLVAASVAPGIAPWVGARVGVARHVEGGLAYTGRVVRADLRRSFDISSHWSLSLGAGGSAALHGHQQGETLPNLDLGELRGWGADAPILIGYGSDAGLYMVWVGGRAGWEHVDIGPLPSTTSTPSAAAPPRTLSATRFWGGGLLGLAAGFRHLHVAMELDVSYASVSGDYKGTHAQIAGLVLTPASCLWWEF